MSRPSCVYFTALAFISLVSSPLTAAENTAATDKTTTTAVLTSSNPVAIGFCLGREFIQRIFKQPRTLEFNRCDQIITAVNEIYPH